MNNIITEMGAKASSSATIEILVDKIVNEMVNRRMHDRLAGDVNPEQVMS